MKKVLVTLSFILIILNSLYSEEKSKYDNTSWRIIEEKIVMHSFISPPLYEKDIRIALKGASNTDTAIMKSIVNSFNTASETISMELNSVDPNFTINIIEPKHGSKTDRHHDYSRLKHKDPSLSQNIIRTFLSIPLDRNMSYSEKSNILHFHVFRSLTRILEVDNKKRRNYGGIFEHNIPSEAILHEIDLDIISKLYSTSFTEGYKSYHIKRYGYTSYLYSKNRSIITYLLVISFTILVITLLFVLLIQNRGVECQISLNNYLKNGFIILSWISALLIILNLSQGRFSLKFSYIEIVVRASLSTFFAGTIVILILYFVENWLITKTRNPRQQISFVFISTLFSVLIVASLITFIQSLFPEFSSKYKLYSYLNIYTIYIASTIALLRSLFMYVQLRTKSLVNQKDVELAKMTALKNQAELQALHSRINPHFLYNSLNSIAGLAETEPKKVQKMSMALSDLFRYAVNKTNDTMVSISQELEMVTKYLEVEKVRFDESLEYSIEIEDKLKEIQIPKFLIQPLVENAIKHGVSNIIEKGIIQVSVKQIDQDIQISVYDNGPDFPEDLVSGYGLQNLHDKLEILYKDDAEIVWENGDQKHIKITLKNQF